MATVNLGSIKFKWKGTYAGGTAYTIDDVVSYNGSSYICIQASTGNLPTDTAYFEQMSQKGSDGTNGTNGTDLGTTLTTQGDIVYRDASGLARLGAGTSGQALVTQGTGANPIWSSVGGTNTPAFHVYNNSDQNISHNTETQVVFNTEVADTDNGFSSNAYTVPTGKGGLYFIYFQLTFSTSVDGSFQHTLKINNTYDSNSGFRVNGMHDYYDSNMYGRIINLSAGDVLTLLTYQSTGVTANVSGGENRAVFGGFKIIQ